MICPISKLTFLKGKANTQKAIVEKWSIATASRPTKTVSRVG